MKSLNRYQKVIQQRIKKGFLPTCYGAFDNVDLIDYSLTITTESQQYGKRVGMVAIVVREVIDNA